MENTEADLSIQLNVTCPHCDNFFDLFDLDGGRLNDDGYLMRNACPDGYWCDTHKKFNEKVQCPDCTKDIEISGIAWQPII